MSESLVNTEILGLFNPLLRKAPNVGSNFNRTLNEANMTPDELKQIAINATKIEFDIILKELELTAKNGALSATFKTISDGAISQLKDAGFDVILKTNYNTIAIGKKLNKYYEVKF